MTENKRFTWIKNTSNKFGLIIDHETGKNLMGTKETCYFMNKQEEEKKQLKEELKKQIQPIQKICQKYHINITDLPETLEEYITLDNEGWSE